MWDLKKKVKGGKWQTVATWTCAPDTCQRNAEIMFQSRGLPVNSNYHVQWSRQLRQQKNWIGMADNCRHFDQAGREVL
jgi:hypothetical protein